MLRNRSRAVTSKQSLMADHISPLPPSSQNPTPPQPTSYFFSSPKFFNGFLSKVSNVAENPSPALIYPNPIAESSTFSETKHSREKIDPCKAIGLALVDSLTDESAIDNHSSTPNSRMVVLGSKLKIQIPPLISSPHSLPNSPKSPADFGIKTRNSRCYSPFGSVNSAIQTVDSPPRALDRSLSLKEMELSEDYTCVISHGPNPKTTHIYDNCVMENCCGGTVELKNEQSSSSDESNSPSQNTLSFC